MATKAGETDGDVKASPGTVETIVQDSSAETTKDAQEAAPPKAAEPESFEDAPDPEEDDLDDLDDMLDEFSPTKTESKPATAEAPKPEKPTADTASDEMADLNGMSEEDFAKHLQADMANLLGGIDSNPELAAQFEEMMAKIAAEGGEGLGDLGINAGPSQPSTKAAAPPGAEESFQDTIKKTMEKLQASGAQATEAAKEEDTDDILAELMKQMQSSGLDGEGGEEDFSKMLLGMMEQLTNKDILYEPMKELNDKYPAWMEKNKATVSKEDLKRFEEQQKVVAEIVTKFEEPSYTDSSPKHREYIVERMQLMQAAGSPPSDLVGDMASAQEAFGAPPDEGCPQQ
ncbi:hypothetical protein O988_00245 [Pseudogymnoascus sp. VKM F-3808]|nr:hypothetical protein O988_00245 [Pseudogymnoascus sp. VKM F-3808]